MKLLVLTILLSSLYISTFFGQLTHKIPSIPNISENSIEIKKNKKINQLIAAFNSYSFSSNESYKKYTLSFGNDSSNFTKHKNWYSGANVTIHKSKVIEDLNKACEIQVYSELDSYILSYQKSALELTALLNKTFSYYDMEDYESDNFLQAKEYHAPILKAYSKFFNADNQLRKQSDKIRIKLKMKNLTQSQKKGRRFNYLIQLAIDKSEKILAITQITEYSQLNTEDLKEASNTLRVVLDELTVLKNEEPKKFNQNYYTSWFYSALKDFIKSSKSLYIRKHNNQQFTTGEQMLLNPSSGWMVNGSTYQVLNRYNSLIDWYNSMNNL